MDVIICGLIMYVIGNGLNMLHDAIFVPKTQNGVYDARFCRGGFLGRMCNRLGIFLFICGIVDVLFL